MYIRYEGEVEAKPNGQKKIGGSRPKFSKMNEQVEFGLKEVVDIIAY